MFGTTKVPTEVYWVSYSSTMFNGSYLWGTVGYALNMLWVHTNYLLVDFFAYKRIKHINHCLEQQISVDNDFFSVNCSVIHFPVFMLTHHGFGL